MIGPRVPLMLAVGLLTGDGVPPLRVIRTTPAEGTADPTTTIAATFDRPVAGSLDQSIDPRTVLTITPSVPGTLEWRDPVTVRFRPAGLLPAGTTFTATVRPGFNALDGSTLAAPVEWTFRVAGPRVLHVEVPGGGRHLSQSPRFRLVTSSPADPALLTRLVYVEMSRACAGQPGTLPVRVVATHGIPTSDSWEVREAGGWERDRRLDSVRQIVTLAPERPLPYDCGGTLSTPERIDRETPGQRAAYGLSTYGPFRLVRTECAYGQFCPNGPISIGFSTPVKGADLLRRISILPEVKFSLADTSDTRDTWTIEADLKPRTGYLVRIDSTLTDMFGQRIAGYPVLAFGTTGFRPSVSHMQGRATVERNGRRTLAITYVNVDTLEVTTVPIPDSLEGRFLSRSWYAWAEDWNALAPRARRRTVVLQAPRDKVSLYGLEFDAPNATRPGTPTLFAVRATSPRLRVKNAAGETVEPYQPIALVQVTDLGVHAKVGPEEGAVWVTGAQDGLPRSAAAVTLRDGRGRVVARAVTDARGIARLSNLRRAAPRPMDADNGESRSFDGYVEVRLGADRALVGINPWDPDLSPWRFNVSGEWGEARRPLAAAVFTERGIYRPGDSVFAKAIVRTGLLGALRAPARTDSVRIVFHAREEGRLRSTVHTPSAFGTAHQVVRLPADAPLGYYTVGVELKREGDWKQVATTSYRVAEYRPPEFLVDMTADTGGRQSGDSLVATVGARYLFGAPMARAALAWSLRLRPLSPWELAIPNTAGYSLGAESWWWDDSPESGGGTTVAATGTDSLDASGHRHIGVRLESPPGGRAATATLEATVTDVNRQTVSSSASAVLHPSAFYLGVKALGGSYFWPAGEARDIGIIAVRPDGRRVPGVAVTGTMVRREWHQVRRERNGYAELVGEWVSDTVATCRATTAVEDAVCRFTPARPGTHMVEVRATDPAGRAVTSSLVRWVTGSGWVPWNDESQFKMDVIPDRERYEVGDTATVLFASPFVNAEAWVTVEREGLLVQRRIHITDGATQLKFPITEAWSPNAFVSILVARGRSAAPGPLDDPGRPTIRVGYARIRVTPERKRLSVALAPDRAEYRPGQTAKIGIAVTDRAGRGMRSEVTLWAVDEGVLSLTRYRTPDPLDLIYRERGLGLRLGSNLTTVAPQVPAGDKGRNPGGGGGDGQSDVLRSRFRTTAFFLGSVVTDSAGAAAPSIKLPDNLTTFRVMAVAVTTADRYGSGHSPLLVTRPLLARPALPRFLRPGDRAIAGVVVNHRLGGTPAVRVSARATGARLEGDVVRSVTLEAGRGREVRFDMRALPGDTAAIRFDVAGARDSDAVLVKLPILSAVRSGAVAATGMLRDTATVALPLSAGLDLARSTVAINAGGSPAALLRGYADHLRVYPYYCSEQVASMATTLIALYRARKLAGAEAGDTVRLRREIGRAVEVLVRRQGTSGGIGLWASTDWTTPWLTVHAGTVLLEAKALGFAVTDSVVARVTDYVRASLRDPARVVFAVMLRDDEARTRRAERLAVAHFLLRAGARDRALENDLFRQAGLLAPEDRLTLALLLARGGDASRARTLVEPFWNATRIDGRLVTLPDSLRESRFYFRSMIRPAARLLEATLAVEPERPLVGPLFATMLERSRAAGPRTWWNTQDYAAAARAVEAWLTRFPPVAGGVVRLSAAGRTFAVRDTTVPLASVLPGGRETGELRLTLGSSPALAPAFYAITVTEIPREVPVRPELRGLVVERWYEAYEGGRPVTEVNEGDLVRVRLRLTVPEDRSFVVLDDALPGGLEVVDVSLRTVGGLPGPGAADSAAIENPDPDETAPRWWYGSWDSGWWSPFEHREIRDDRVVWSARVLWRGTYTVTYLARATTPGVFVRPPAHAEEMYNPAVFGRSDGGVFTVRARP
jgi:hypothetical protein